MAEIYKIMSDAEWQAALSSGTFEGSAVDLADGFVHLSARHQVLETAARHFAGKHGVFLIAFEEGDFGDALKWEVSRNGDRFPHVYGPLDPARALWVRPLPWLNGSHLFPEGF
jgi:uncharacterized protein (DUF952 family)